MRTIKTLCIYTVAMFHIVADCALFATTFYKNYRSFLPSILLSQSQSLALDFDLILKRGSEKWRRL